MTAQINEWLIIDQKIVEMAFCPPLPVEHPRIYERSPEEVFWDEHDILDSTACWRGYLGTWEIKDDRFYLVRLAGRFRVRGGAPIHADWFSGVLRVPMGEVLQYVHMGFGSVYEQELHIKVENGVVVMTRTIDNREPRGILQKPSCLSHAAKSVWSFWR